MGIGDFLPFETSEIDEHDATDSEDPRHSLARQSYGLPATLA